MYLYLCVHLFHLKGQWNAKAMPASRPCPTSIHIPHSRSNPIRFRFRILVLHWFLARFGSEPFKSIPVFFLFFFCFFSSLLYFLFWYGEDPVLFIFIVAFLVELVCSYIGFDLVAKIYLPVSQSTVSTVFIDPLSCGNISFISHINKVDNRGHFIRSLSVTGQFIHSLLNSKTD